MSRSERIASSKKISLLLFVFSLSFSKNKISDDTVVPANSLKAELGKRTPPRNATSSLISFKIELERLLAVPIEVTKPITPFSCSKSTDFLKK